MISKEQFERYEKVRISGVTNMLRIKVVCKLSKLTKKQCLEITKNYATLKARMKGGKSGSSTD